jgi:hypothetical protein
MSWICSSPTSSMGALEERPGTEKKGRARKWKQRAPFHYTKRHEHQHHHQACGDAVTIQDDVFLAIPAMLVVVLLMLMFILASGLGQEGTMHLVGNIVMLALMLLVLLGSGYFLLQCIRNRRRHPWC